MREGFQGHETSPCAGKNMEEVGFEPTVRVNVHTLSKRAP
jgi:hypothetical protein